MTDQALLDLAAAEMRAISLWQPWASFFVDGPKIHETRSWPTSHRGWLAIHATSVSPRLPSLAVVGAAAEVFGVSAPHEYDDARRIRLVGESIDGLPAGAIVGLVRIDDCVPVEEAGPGRVDRMLGDYSAGRFAWRRGDAIKLPEPVPCRGRQRIWKVPPSTARWVLEQAKQVRL
jgi:hypothetical protein